MYSVCLHPSLNLDRLNCVRLCCAMFSVCVAWVSLTRSAQRTSVTVSSVSGLLSIRSYRTTCQPLRTETRGIELNGQFA